MKSIFMGLSLMIAAGVIVPDASAAGLNGATIFAQQFCCYSATVTPPVYQVTNLVQSVIGAGVELPTGSFVATTSLAIVPQEIDYQVESERDLSIVITFEGASQAIGAGLNGPFFIYDFYMPGFQNISIAIDPVSTITPVSSYAIQVGHFYVSLDPRQSVAVGDKLIVDLQAVQIGTIDEPSTMASLAAGLSVFGLVRRRSKKPSAT